MNNPQMMPVALDFGRTDSRWTPTGGPRRAPARRPHHRVRHVAAARLHRLADRLEPALAANRPVAC